MTSIAPRLFVTLKSKAAAIATAADHYHLIPAREKEKGKERAQRYNNAIPGISDIKAKKGKKCFMPSAAAAAAAALV